MASSTVPTLNFVSSISPASSARAWHTAPHPYLPLLATASSDKTVRISSLTSFTLLSTITGGHKRSVRSCAWKPGMKGDRESVLATGSFDASAGIWKGDNSRHTANASGSDDEDHDGDDGDEDYRFAVILEGHDSEIKSVAWSAHGTFLATCSRDKSVWIWEALEESGAGGFGGAADDDDNFETVAVLQEHEGDVKCVAWHPTEESCLASSSYDDLVRVWREDADAEWGCVAVCEGHKGTVWCVDWEPEGNMEGLKNGTEVLKSEEENGDPAEVSGPRLVSCSDDLSIRVWRRQPKARPHRPDGPRIPSIIRSTADEETWFEESQLPQRHNRAIYAVGWSKISRRIVSAGSDGMIVVYEERPKPNQNNDIHMEGSDEPAQSPFEWVVVAEVEGAHGVFEINHVCWAKRYDKGRTMDNEEVVVSTGDDGEVKMWSINSGP